MTFAEYATRSVSDARVLVQIDISKLNGQWVCIGAGIWKVNTEGLYPEVDDSLLDGFTAQTFGDIGSILIDGLSATKVTTLATLTDDTNAYFWDSANNDLYVCLPNYDYPWQHNIFIGAIHGYSLDEFIPSGATVLYEGRLVDSPRISQSRDPLFWGKMKYDVGGVSLKNHDGELDTFAQDHDCYGNEARILYGYKQLNIADYVCLYSGILQNISISEEEISFDFSDRRMQLTKPIQYSCTELNALEAIEEILLQSYNIQYNSSFYDTIAWEAAKALVPDITIAMREESETIRVIEDICGTVFGIFKIEPDNRFSFKIVDTSATTQTTITSNNILNHHSINYNPGEVISSVRVGYDKNWDTDYISNYTFITDTSQEIAVFLKYKTYCQKTFYTLLTNATDAQAFATKILNYAKDVHGIGELVVPMLYYAYGVGDIVNAEIRRETTDMLGTKKIEIISKAYNLKAGTITFGYRIV